MQRFTKTSLLGGASFGAFMGILFGLRYGPVAGVLGGLGSGLLFSQSIGAFVARQRVKFSGQCPLSEGERVIKEGPVNHLRRAEGVGGWLYLTNERLYFRSHKVNIQVHELSLPLPNGSLLIALRAARAGQANAVRRTWPTGTLPVGTGEH